VGFFWFPPIACGIDAIRTREYGVAGIPCSTPFAGRRLSLSSKTWNVLDPRLSRYVALG
jgi:hypothetical protein